MAALILSFSFIFIYICICIHFVLSKFKIHLLKPTGYVIGAWGGVVVTALRYYSEGPGIDPRSLGHQRVPCALGSTQPLKMSTRIFLGVKTAGA